MAEAGHFARWLNSGRIWPKAIGLGAIAGLGQAPVGLPWASLLALALIFWMLLHSDSPRRAARLGWQFGIGYFRLTLFWIVEPFFVDP